MCIRDRIETLSHHVSIDRDEVVITLQRDGRLVAERLAARGPG